MQIYGRKSDMPSELVYGRRERMSLFLNTFSSHAESSVTVTQQKSVECRSKTMRLIEMDVDACSFSVRAGENCSLIAVDNTQEHIQRSAFHFLRS